MALHAPPRATSESGRGGASLFIIFLTHFLQKRVATTRFADPVRSPSIINETRRSLYRFDRRSILWMFSVLVFEIGDRIPYKMWPKLSKQKYKVIQSWIITRIVWIWGWILTYARCIKNCLMHINLGRNWVFL